jgi:hypothetical protein
MKTEKSNVKMKKVYSSANQCQETQALKQLGKLREEMKQRGLRIVGEHMIDHDIIEFRYLCQGVPAHICLQEKDLQKLIKEKQFELLS